MADQLKDGLPRRAFAYAPSDDPSSWKLPYLTAAGAPDPAHLPGAAAALSPGGFRGEKVDVAESDLPAVKARLRQAYKKWKGTDVKFPASIAEVNTYLANAFETMVREDFGYAPGCTGCGHPNECDCSTCPCPFHCDPSVGDAQVASSILSQLYSLKSGEAGETAQLAMIDNAITAMLKFSAAEAAEIGSPSAPAAAVPSGVTETAVEEAGKRNAKNDQSHLNQALVHAHQTIGHIIESGGVLPDDASAGASGAKAPTAEGATPKAASVAESEPEVEFTGTAAEKSIHEAAGYGEFVVNFAEGDAQWISDKEVWITPIRSGFGNQVDSMYYPKETLKKAVQEGLFDNVKMFANHPPRNSDPRDARDVRDWVGSVKETVWDPKTDAPRSHIRIYDTQFAERAHEAPDEIAFSVRGKAMARKARVGGRDANVAEAFSKVHSVDWVTEAGAGGAMNFSESASEESTMPQIDLDTLTLDQLRDGNPALFAAVVAEAKPAGDPPAPAPTAAVPDQDLLDRINALETERAAERTAREAADARTARGVTNMALVREAVAATVLPGDAKAQVEAYFAEGAVDFEDPELLKGAVARQVKLIGDTIAKYGGKPSVTGIGSYSAPAGAPAPIAEAAAALGARMAGYAPAPQKPKLVFEPGFVPPVNGQMSAVSESGAPAIEPPDQSTSVGRLAAALARA